MGTYLKQFNAIEDYKSYMSGNLEETHLPNVSLVNGDIQFQNILPEIDTTGYATTFVNGNIYKKEAALFKLIFDTFAKGYDPDIYDPAIWMDLSVGTIDVFLYTDRQMFSIVDEPLYKNYLSKITNFCDADTGDPTSTLNFFPEYMDRDEYIISDGISKNLNSSINYVTGEFIEK